MVRPTKASILIVDDNPNKLLALEAVLLPLHQRLVCADSGRGALRLLLREDFAVILLDVRMADMDGFETAELIRRRVRSEHTPIIFVTAFGEAEADMARGYSLGAVDFVFSPIQPEVLRNKVSVFVDLHLKSEEIRRQTERLRRLEAIEHRRRLERAESGRRQAEARFATMLDIAGDAIIAVDDEHSIILFNKAAESTFGRNSVETIGHRLDELLVEDVDAMLRDPSANGRVRAAEVRGVRADGSEFPAEASVAHTPDGDRSLWTVILRDVTRRREAEDQVRRLNTLLGERLRTGVDMVTDLAATLDPAEVLDRLLHRAAPAVHAEWGSLLRVDSERMVVVGSHDLNPRRRIDRLVRLDDQPLLLEALQERRPVIATPFAVDMLPAAARAWEAQPHSLAVLPLSIGERIVAVLLLGRRGGAGFSDDDVEMLQLIANVAVVALRNAELFSQAEESSRSKSDFLNLAAHELRTPLSVVRGYASMLADGSLGAPPAPFGRPLEVLSAKLDELNTLVDDLLMAARAEAGRLVGTAEPVDLRAAVIAAAERARPRVELVRGHVEAQVGDDPVVASTDPEHVARILDNLLNNALAYTVGPPRVRVWLECGEQAVLRVEDQGPGVPAGMHDQIFERFVRIDHPSVGPRPGTGLGLYISREMAQRHGGTLDLERTGPDGSCFRLILPLSSAHVEPAPAFDGTDEEASSPTRAAAAD